jgi:hypothetical protein
MSITPEMVKAYVEGYRESGCDELTLGPGSACLDQVDLLAEAVA